MPRASDRDFARYLVVVQRRAAVLVLAERLEEAQRIARDLALEHGEARVAIVDFVGGTVLRVERSRSAPPRGRRSSATAGKR